MRSGPLTKRQLDVLELLALGNTQQQIANKLFVSVQTVKFHVYTIRNDLGASNSAHIVHRAWSMGLLGPDGLARGPNGSGPFVREQIT